MARSLFRGAVITTGLPPSPQASTQPRPINSHHQAPSAASPLPSSSPLLTIPDAFDWDVLFKEQKANWARQEAAAAVAVAPPPSPGSPDTPPAPVFVQVEAPVTPPLGRESPLNPFSCSSLPTLPWRISAEVLQDVVRGAAAKAVARYGPLPSFSRRMESHSGLLMEEDEEGSGLIAEIQRSLDFE